MMFPHSGPDPETLQKWHDDPSNWRFGVFYCNPKDKRLIVLRRLKWFGVTLNFGNPDIIPCMLAILLALGLIALL